jgi:hypothetical protein
VQVSVAPLRMSLQHERKNGPLQNMVRQAAVYPVADKSMRAQAKGLVNGFMAASLMFDEHARAGQRACEWLYGRQLDEAAQRLCTQ